MRAFIRASLLIPMALAALASPLLAQAGHGAHAGADSAAHAGDAALADREIKALSAEEMAALLAGEGMGFALGARVVELERTLDRRFAHRHIDARVVGELTAEIARLRGEIRAIHLVTHLEVDPLLTDAQREGYQRLRGY